MGDFFLFSTQIRWLRLLQIALDITLVSLSLFLAFYLRFDGSIEPKYIHEYTLFLPFVITIQILANFVFGVYRRLWRYTGLTEVMELGISVLGCLTLLYIIRVSGLLVYHNEQLSYAVIFIYGLIVSAFMAAPRILRRLMIEHLQRRHWRQPFRKRAIVVGAGDAGQLVIKELEQRQDLGTDVVGIVDDDPQKHNRKMGRYMVIGPSSKLHNYIDNYQVDQVIIAIPSATSDQIRSIIDICRECEVETKILPGLFELINGKVSINQLREVSLEDLLGRDPVKLDSDSIAHYIENRTVLITGAGGSIGSELARQVLTYEPNTILLLGKGENSIFSIYEELKLKPGPAKIIPIIADIRDTQRLYNIFEMYKPQVVFHAAAHKHVYLMEVNVVEAVSNNVLGTYNLAKLSSDFKVESFVLVSSDKAVNPTSIMGASKRIAEMIIQQINQKSSTKFVAVRFGNVLASRGSVILVWKNQIANGGPVTVTHKDAIRYFMLIPEAVQLIIQAAALSQGQGEIFVLDMGKPVKILDLAYDLIKFSGLRPDKDIKIEFTGLKPGEKLFEELLTNEEGLQKTLNEKILVGNPKPLTESQINEHLEKLKLFCIENNENQIREYFSEIIEGSLINKKQI